MNDIPFEWKTEVYDQYIKVELAGKPGYITIKAEGDGFVVDVWPDEGNESDSTCYSFYDDLEVPRI